MLDKETVIGIVKQYAEEVLAKLSPSAFVLFGSYANGNARDDSDIDVGVMFDDFTGDWLETSTLLWRARRDISLDIEPHLLDIKNDKSGFAAFVMKTGLMIREV